MLITIFGTIIVIYLIILIFVYIIQHKMVYFPSHTISVTPRDANLEFEDLYLTTSDGVNINAWYVPAVASQATIIICHGNGGNISHRLETIELFNQLNLSVLIFDYRGYGRSEGKTTEDGTYKDAEAAWDYLIKTKNVPPENIIIFGRSLGGAVACWLAREKSPAVLIVESSFTSIPDIAAKLYPYLPIRLIARYKYDSKEYIKGIKSPVLFIHSPDDDLVAYDLGKKLFEVANEPREFLEISGSHNEGFLSSGNHYKNGIKNFLDKHMPK
ncbi:MAG: alpha/beta hydrolase [Candidatus Zixiibacteriota bacterium]